MKLIIQNNRIAATATDDHTGPETFVAAPPDVDPARLSEYVVIDGKVRLCPPTVVTMRQARLALLDAGLLGQVEAALAAFPEPARTGAQIEWEYAAVVERSAPFVALLGGALGFDEAALDALFLDAAGR